MLKLGAWPVRVLWLSLPFTLGPLLADALRDTETGFRTSVSVGAWLAWGAVLLASIVPFPVSLTLVRCAAPATVVIALSAGVEVDVGTDAAVAAATTAVLTVVALLPTTGAIFVDGPSYGSERRLALRPPALLLSGPIEAAWLAVLVGSLAGPLWLAAQMWLAGVVAIIVGFPVAFLAFRALLSLARRWLVFVPAGLVLHDHLAVRDPTLFSRRSIAAVGPAPADSVAIDLTQRAFGLALEVRLRESVSAALASKGDSGSDAGLTKLEAFLVTPSLPGAVLDEAEQRRLSVR